MDQDLREISFFQSKRQRHNTPADIHRKKKCIRLHIMSEMQNTKTKTNRQMQCFNDRQIHKNAFHVDYNE